MSGTITLLTAARAASAPVVVVQPAVVANGSGDWRDRTCEFATIVEAAAQKKAQVQALAQQRTASAPPMSSSQFAIVAARLGREIHLTSQKLAKLTKAAKTTSLFGECVAAPEISQLTADINEDVHRMNSELDSLKAEAEKMKTQQSRRERAHKAALKNNVAAHSESIVSYFGVLLSRTTSDFRDVLHQRTENLKKQQDQKQRLIGSALPNPNLFLRKEASAPPSSFQGSRAPPFPPPNVEDGTGDPSGGQMQLRPQQQQQLLLGGGADLAYMNSRVDAVRQVEAGLQQLQQVFHQVANLVAEQGELVQRIDDNVDESYHHVEDAERLLVGELSRVSRNRWLIVKVFAVLIVFAVIFILFFV
eukprot:TRINITY_DN1119_c0_g1_i9.p1 TRINITY_DN1119_c0_g1~~TRINITY_DN1119_c0_g1_i9.p1  ORF type:complete len:362 (+),score=126.71 TRINITY_DN1119_c0_g1_i9:87-1172(+)